MKKNKSLRKKAIQLRRQGKSLLEICDTIGKSKSTVWYWIEGVIDRILPSLRDQIDDECFSIAVTQASSITGVCRYLKISHGNHLSIKRRIVDSILDTSHFRWPITRVRLTKSTTGRPPKPLSEILIKDSTYTCNDRLKIRLLAANYFKRKCHMCDRYTWLNQPVPIQLHHKNEVKTDNRIENLTILCASCHALIHGWNVRRIVRGRPLKEILVKKSTYTNPTRIRDKLLTAGYFEYKCYECDLRLWQGEPIPIQLHHKNGVKSDWRLKNLNILCPNCHGLTDNWCGRFA